MNAFIVLLGQVAPRSDMQDNWLTTTGLVVLCVLMVAAYVRSYRKGR